MAPSGIKPDEGLDESLPWKGCIEKAFQPFYTTKTEGLGMGLSIGRSFILRHQGRMWAKNNPDKGTTFYLT